MLLNLPFQSQFRSRRRALRRILTVLLAFACVCAGIIAPARANDSTAVLEAGGLRLTVNSGAAMVSEDLRISPHVIDISYVFRNTGDTPVTTLVAFPLPLLPAGDPEIADALPREGDPLNFVGFTISVDGQPVTPAVEQRASVLGLDITDRLKADGVPLNPFAGPAAHAALARLPKDKRDFYVHNGLAVWSGEEPLSVQWDVATSFYWQQVFPPGKDVKVLHRYLPVSGAHLMRAADLAAPGAVEALRRRYCIADADLERLRHWLTPRPGGTPPQALRASVHYVLRTGANWAGPIGTFRLTVAKPAPDAIVAFCRPEGLPDGTGGLFEARDFLPRSDLSILFVRRPEP